jgi:RNA polymerase sigma-70 factor (ECF subfamily)
VAPADASAADAESAMAIPVPALAPDRDDGSLVLQARAGELAAFDALVGRYMDRAYAVAMRLMRQREDAEDLVQDAFIQALQMLQRFDARRSFGPWFFRILVNRGMNLRRSRRVRSTEEMPPDVVAREDSPARQLERQELRERLCAAIERLPERERMVVELFELEGFDSAEIADILDIPRGTVRWHLHQARRALRQQLAAYQGEDA